MELGDVGEFGVPDQRMNERIRLGKGSCDVAMAF